MECEDCSAQPTYQIKRHPPFMTQQYICKRQGEAGVSGNSRCARQGHAGGGPENAHSVPQRPASASAATGATRLAKESKLYDMVSVCRDCYRVYLCKEHVKLQGMIRG